MSLGAARPRLVVVDALALGSPLDPYLSLRAAAGYTSRSVRWLRARLTDPHHPLPCYRLPGGQVLLRRGELDAWLARYRQVGHPDVARVVSAALAGLR